MQRRNFLKTTGLAALSVTSLSQYLNANTSGSTTGYKAIVVILLDGGNENFNMVVPTGDSQYPHYKKYRSPAEGETDGKEELYVHNNDLGAIDVDAQGYYTNNGTPHPYEKDGNKLEEVYRAGVYDLANSDGAKVGLNGLMPELKSMYDSGKMSVAYNVGTLSQPTTRDDLLNKKSTTRPVFLRSHNNQKKLVQTGIADRITQFGWAGKLADIWNINTLSGLNLSYGGSRLMVGAKTVPLHLSGNAAEAFASPYEYKDNSNSIREFFNAQSFGGMFQNHYMNKINRASKLSSLLLSFENSPSGKGHAFSSSNTYGKKLFTTPSLNNEFNISSTDGANYIGANLKNIAQMLNYQKTSLGSNKNIISLRMPRFDMHSDLNINHPNSMRSLSLALSDFQKALEELGLDKDVVTFTITDFGRSLVTNSTGSDHGWGGHSIITSGADAFQGGKIFGNSNLNLDIDDDNADILPGKGTMVPTTSIEQMVSPILDWFGASESDLTSIFPNLSNFRTTEEFNSAYMPNMFS